MYRSVLVANRGDCAARLIRTCHEMGIIAVLVSSRDETARVPQAMADEIVYTGMSREAYTAQDDILEAARRSGCEAILPGWGFLSEEFGFARRARLMGLHFVGPSDRQLQLFGDKWRTQEWLVPRLGLSSDAVLCSDPDLQKKLDALPGPWMFKGRFGGGGKEVFKYADRAGVESRAFLVVERGAGGRYFVEPAVEEARHIEFQIMGDGRGTVKVVGVRDCTAQINHQKWLEYSVSGNARAIWREISDRIEVAFGTARYFGWGTVEFLMDDGGAMHLLEVNPRLQVEHGVTEMSARCDLVRTALELSCYGHWNRDIFLLPVDDDRDVSVEFRLFARSAGVLEKFGFDGYEWPAHRFSGDASYRFEPGYMPGDAVTGAFDGLLARFLVCGERACVLEKLRTWVRGFRCAGVENNLESLFRSGCSGISVDE